MPEITSTLESAPGGDGPFMVTTRKDGLVTNVTPTIGTLLAALDQAKSDQAAALSGLTWVRSLIHTDAK